MGGAPLTASAAAPTTPGRAPSGTFGRLAFGFLAVSVLSGAALVPFYSPAHPLESLERIEGGIPWAFFLRALHAWSSFGLLASLVVHVVQVVAKGTERLLPPAIWWRSVLLLPVTVLALLGGFVLRGDAEAGAALAVWRRLLETLPLAGPETARLLLGSAAADLGPAALHHAGTFALLLWLLTAEHGARLFPDGRSTVLAGLVSIALAGAVPLSLGPPPGPDHALLLGPWYLLGLQGLLVDLPVAGAWIASAGVVALLGLVRHAGPRARRALVLALAVWAIGYAGFTVRVLLLSKG